MNEVENKWNKSEAEIHDILKELYQDQSEKALSELKRITDLARQHRDHKLCELDRHKTANQGWFLSNQLVGMSLYVDRFAGKLNDLASHLDYLLSLGVNTIHLMPIFQSPKDESDGGYAVSDFRTIDERFGTLDDLRRLIKTMHDRGMYVMLDIVLNHTSYKHEWAKKAKAGIKEFMDYYYMFPDRSIPDQYDQAMPEIFPESSPGNFTFIEDCNRWVMTVFHHYQWDLNYKNYKVLIEMVDTIFFYANLGVDILRIDAPAFIWKEIGTTCQNLPKAHLLLRLIKQVVNLAAPGMALLGEAIVSPEEIMKYFGTDAYLARECDFAYNATLMALQWDALATGKTKVLRNEQYKLLEKPLGTSWITYTRCHDDIGLGFSDQAIYDAGFEAYPHRLYLKQYYSGEYEGSVAKGALFSVNPKTNDARISGSLASLCGLEYAIERKDSQLINQSIKKILLMQAHSFFIGGLPMLFYGDEIGYTNDYSYLHDPGKSYDNRWMHRPIIQWDKLMRLDQPGTVERTIFEGTKKLILLRKQFSCIADHKNISWLPDEDMHLSAFVRYDEKEKVFCLFNFAGIPIFISWYVFKQYASQGDVMYDYWNDKAFLIGADKEHFILEGYGMIIAKSM